MSFRSHRGGSRGASAPVSGLATSQSLSRVEAGLSTPPNTNSSSKDNSRNDNSAERLRKHSTGKRLPFEGKSFYLELKCAKPSLTKRVAEEVMALGGIVDGCFSKDTSYVVSNDEEARYWKKHHSVGRDSDSRSPYRSPLILDSPADTPSPIDGSPGAASCALAPPAKVSRAQALLEKARGSSGKRQTNSIQATAENVAKSGTSRNSDGGVVKLSGILAKAKALGIKVIHVDALLQLIDNWKKKLSSRDNSPAAVAPSDATDAGVFQEAKLRTLRAPFLKIEDLSGNLRPVVAELREWPVLYLNGRPSTFSPFVKNGIGGRGNDKSEADVGDIPNRATTRQQRKKAAEVAAADASPADEDLAPDHVNRKSMEKKDHTFKDRLKQALKRKEVEKKAGFCECCQEYYREGIDEHVRSAKHAAFVSDSSNFASIDAMIASLPSISDLLTKFVETEMTKTPPSSTTTETIPATPPRDACETPCRPKPDSAHCKGNSKLRRSMQSPRFFSPTSSNRGFSPSAKKLKMAAIATLNRSGAKKKKEASTTLTTTTPAADSRDLSCIVEAADSQECAKSTTTTKETTPEHPIGAPSLSALTVITACSDKPTYTPTTASSTINDYNTAVPGSSENPPKYDEAPKSDVSMNSKESVEIALDMNELNKTLFSSQQSQKVPFNESIKIKEAFRSTTLLHNSQYTLSTMKELLKPNSSATTLGQTSGLVPFENSTESTPKCPTQSASPILAEISSATEILKENPKPQPPVVIAIPALASSVPPVRVRNEEDSPTKNVSNSTMKLRATKPLDSKDSTPSRSPSKKRTRNCAGTPSPVPSFSAASSSTQSTAERRRPLTRKSLSVCSPPVPKIETTPSRTVATNRESRSPEAKKRDRKPFWYYVPADESPEADKSANDSTLPYQSSQTTGEASSPSTKSADMVCAKLAQLLGLRKSAVKASANVSSNFQRGMMEITTGKTPELSRQNSSERTAKEARREEKRKQKEEKRKMKKLAKEQVKAERREKKENDAGVEETHAQPIADDFLENTISKFNDHLEKSLSPIDPNAAILGAAAAALSSLSHDTPPRRTRPLRANYALINEIPTNPDLGASTYVCTPSRKGVRISISRPSSPSGSRCRTPSQGSTSQPPHQPDSRDVAPKHFPVGDAEYELTPTRNARLGIRLVRRNSSNSLAPSEASEETLVEVAPFAKNVSKPSTPKRLPSPSVKGPRRASERSTPTRRASLRTCKEIAKCSISEQLWSPPKSRRGATSSAPLDKVHVVASPSSTPPIKRSRRTLVMAKDMEADVSEPPLTKPIDLTSSFRRLDNPVPSVVNNPVIDAMADDLLNKIATAPATDVVMTPARTNKLRRKKKPNDFSIQDADSTILCNSSSPSTASPRHTLNSRLFGTSIAAPPFQISHGDPSRFSATTPSGRPPRCVTSTPPSAAPAFAASTPLATSKNSGPNLISPPLPPDYDDLDDFQPSDRPIDRRRTMTASSRETAGADVNSCRVKLVRLSPTSKADQSMDNETQAVSGTPKTSRPRMLLTSPNDDGDDDDFDFRSTRRVSPRKTCNESSLRQQQHQQQTVAKRGWRQTTPRRSSPRKIKIDRSSPLSRPKN